MKGSLEAAERIEGRAKSAEATPVGGSRPNSSTTRTPSQKVHHILYIIDQFCELGGAERVLLEIVRRLPSDLFRCTVVTFKADSGFEQMRCVCPALRVLPLRRTYDIRAIRTGLQLRNLIRRENVSIVHTFFETSDLWAAPLAKLSGCRVLVSSRRDMGILRSRKHKFAYPLINRIFDRVLVVSDEVREYALAYDCLRPQCVETLYNGVDLEALDASAGVAQVRSSLAPRPESMVISTLANIRHVKGIDVLVQAAARVCLEHPETVFLVVGAALEPQTFRKLLTLVDSAGLQDNFRFLGAMSNPYPVLAASDVFCLPSRSEGFSNALIEAMGCRLPCVATRVGGNAEAVTEGVSGFLVPNEDSVAMADRILRLIRDPHLRRKMGEAARHRVESDFSVHGMVARLASIYQELLAAKNV